MAYSPVGWGPIRLDKGPLILSYHDAHQSLAFFADDVRTVEVADLGTIVSVTLVMTIDTGSTTFSLFIPSVVLPENQNAVTITTEGITTLHRLFIPPFGGPQREIYTVTALSGTAADWPLPL